MLMKKKLFIPLLLASAVLLFSMSGCKYYYDRPLRYSPVAARLDGVLYYDGEMDYSEWEYNQKDYKFGLDESGFRAQILRRIYSESDTVSLFIYVDEEVPFKLYEKYYFQSEPDSGNYARVGSMVSTDGYILFTEHTSDGISGVFEFSAVDKGDDSVEIEVTDGIFENLWYSSF